MQSDVIYGRNNIIEALNSNRTIDKIFVSKTAKDSRINKIVNSAKEKKIPVTFLENRKFDSKFDFKNTQGVAAYVAVRDYFDVDYILKSASDKNEKPFIIIADEITDPHNLGAIIRTADIFGAHGVIISKRRSCNLNASVEKASGGALNYVPVAKVTNLVSTVKELKKRGIWVYGTDMNADKVYYDEDYNSPLAIIVGSEGSGISKLLKEECDIMLSIPMKGHVGCLNASVAAGVIMQQVLKSRLGR